ncbi:hypothetical protein GCM10027440_01540 [Nocardiopsis coralliicola]
MIPCGGRPLPLRDLPVRAPEPFRGARTGSARRRSSGGGALSETPSELPIPDGEFSARSLRVLFPAPSFRRSPRAMRFFPVTPCAPPAGPSGGTGARNPAGPSTRVDSPQAISARQ